MPTLSRVFHLSPTDVKALTIGELGAYRNELDQITKAVGDG